MALHPMCPPLTNFPHHQTASFDRQSRLESWIVSPGDHGGELEYMNPNSNRVSFQLLGQVEVDRDNQQCKLVMTMNDEYMENE
jgi:hypothetical protein